MPEIKPFQALPSIKANTGPVQGTSQAPMIPQEAVPRGTSEVAATPATPVEEPQKETGIDSERFAALTKKERQIQKRARELQEREAKISKWEEADKLASTNKLEAMKRLGISYDELTNLHLSQMSADDHTPEAIATRKAQEITRQELDAYKKQVEAKDAALQQEQYQAAKVQLEKEAQALTNSKQEDFAYINAESAHDTIVELIEQTYFEDGRLMSVEEAAVEVEKYLESKYDKISQVEKFRSKYLPPKVEDSKPLAQPDHIQKPQTLTHRATTAPTKPRNYTQAELRERAIRRFHGQPLD